MGIFSLFGKKDHRQTKSAERDSSRSNRTTSGTRPDGGKSRTRTTIKRDAQAALATALKIDAIESEMSSEFVNVTTTQPQHHTKSPAPPAEQVKPQVAVSPPAAKVPPPARPVEQPPAEKAISALESATDFLLDGQASAGDIAAPASDAAAVLEEAAIMYASGQSQLVEQILVGAISDDSLGEMAMTAWLMLFDLCRITGKQQEFDNLAIAFLEKFETSPPAWTDGLQESAQPSASPGTTPMVSFTGKLDAASVKYIERIQKLAETYRTLRLEFVRVTDADAAGCGLLQGALMKLQKSGHDLILVGASELAAKIHAKLEVGRRDDSENAWLLLLELLRLLNREKEFEEISIDYCVTFEVSPPAFVAPQNKVTTAAEMAAVAEAEGFQMPTVIEGRIDNLIVAIAAYSDEHNPAIIDCTRLVRIDFNAASRLLSGLAPFCGVGKVIEFHHVNHLVAQLFNVIGLKDIARIFPRKN